VRSHRPDLRFLKIYDQYKKAPEVTRQRMYLEPGAVLGGADKIILDSRRPRRGFHVVLSAAQRALPSIADT